MLKFDPDRGYRITFSRQEFTLFSNDYNMWDVNTVFTMNTSLEAFAFIFNDQTIRKARSGTEEKSSKDACEGELIRVDRLIQSRINF